MKSKRVYRRRCILAIVTLASTFGLAAAEFEAPGAVTTLPVPEPGVPTNVQKPVSSLQLQTLREGLKTQALVSVALSGGTDVNVSNLEGNESEVSIAVNPTNPDNQVIAGHSPDFHTMNTFHSMDGGSTWSLVSIGNAGEANVSDGRTSSFRFDPTLAFDADGNLYVAYGLTEVESEVLGTTQTTVMVAKSTDGGQSFSHFTFTGSAPDNPAGTTDFPGSDKWLVTTGPDPSNFGQQNVYVAFTGNFDQGVLDQRILVLFSWDGGITFPSAVIVNDGPLDNPPVFGAGNIGAAPAVGPDGTLYVTWWNANTKKIFVDLSTNGGFSFNTDNTVAITTLGFDDKIPPQPDRGIAPLPSIAVDRSGGANNGRIYLVYCDVATALPDTDIYVRSSGDQGATWTPATRVNDDLGQNSQFLPWISVDNATGKVAVTWYDARNDPNNQKVETFMAVSEDGGATFGTNVVVSDNASDESAANSSRTLNNFLEYIGIDCQEGTAYLVWADNSENPADLDYFTDHVVLQGGPNPNQAPTANAGTDQTVNIGDLVTLDGSGSFDPDNGPGSLTYSWTQTQGPVVTLAGDNTASPSFTPTEAGTYEFQLIVNDGESNSAPDTVTITVENLPPPNEAPTADAGADQTVNVGALVTLDGSGSFDPDNGPGALTYSWTQTGGPAVSLAGETTSSPSFTPSQQGTYEFQLIVNDGAVDSAPDVVTVTVEPNGGGGTIQDLIDQVGALGLPNGIQTSFLAKLNAATDSGEPAVRNNLLKAFINEVNAQRGKKLTNTQADALIAAAEAAIV